MKKNLLLVVCILAASISSFAQFNINQPSDFEICEEFDGGFATFNLDVKTPEILGNLNPNDFTVSYHLSITDAFNSVNPLSSPYSNTTNPETIFVSVFENATGNIEVISFDLIVNPVPYYEWSFGLNACDSGAQDGIATFDLTGLEQEFINGSSNLTVTYFENYQDAELGINMIFDPTAYTNIVPFSQNIFIRVENVITGCFFVNTVPGLTLNVGPLNIANTPSPYIVCDDDGDGFATYSLDSKTPEILGGSQNPTLSVTYHETQSDADVGINALPNDYVNSTQFNQVLFARVFQDSGCYQIVTLDLVVDVNCLLINPVVTLESCTDDPNLSATFNLTQVNTSIVNGQDTADFNFTYYLSEADADNQVDPIPNPDSYVSIIPSEVIYVYVEDLTTGNSAIGSIFLVPVLGPQIFLENVYTACDGQSIVLTPSTNGGDNFSFLWSTGATDPEIEVSAPGTYSVLVTDLASGCISEAITQVVEGESPNLGAAPNLTGCAGNNIFDLSINLEDILLGEDPNQFIINYYESITFATLEIDPIQTPDDYEQLGSQVQTIFVRVQTPNSSCFSISEFDVITQDACQSIVDCAEAPLNNTFCYGSNWQTQEQALYFYESSDGAPLQVLFLAGQVEVNFDALVVLDSDGVTNLNPASTTYGNNGDVTGLSFMSSGSSLTIYVDSDDTISCLDQNYTPIDYVISCINTQAPPNCNVILTSFENGALNVNENTNLSWNPASGFVSGYKLSLGITSGGTEIIDNEDVGNVLTYDLDPLEYEVTYYLTIVPYNNNGDAESCEEFSFTTRANPNQIVVCEDGVVNTTYCYDNNDTTEFNFQSSDDLPLTLVFNEGSTEVIFDNIFIVDSDGTILNPNSPFGNAGDFTGLTYTSTGSSITVRFDSDGSISCADGSGCCAVPFDFDVFCSSSIGIIEVNAFVDADANTVFDANEFSFSNGYFTYEVNGDGNVNTVNSSTGSFQIISENDTDTYEITFNLYEESADCFDITTSNFSNISVNEGDTLTIDFPVVEEQSCEDLAVYLINYWTPPRPGFSHENFLVLENLGFTTIASGTVEFVHDPLLVFNGVTSVNPNYTITTTATGFTVDFLNLQPGDSEFIDISLTCPVEVELGDIVTNTVTYLTDTNDLVVSNNYSTLSEVVVASWDPNDKMEAHGPRVLFDDFVASDEWLYYTIRFQNLGTFPATFVRIDDALNNQLDETTFQMLRSSHDYVVTRIDRDLEWFFEDINLPAEQDDAEGSQGYVYFRIKPKPGYALGDVIPNTAAIFFDFNAPVITNRFETEFIEETLSVSEFDLKEFRMYPNPAKDVVTLKLNNIAQANLSVVDIQGKLIKEQRIYNQTQVELDVSDLQAGLYFVKLHTGSKALIKKLIIE
jgi:hypothetical protein